MTSFTNTIVIKRPIEDVFKVLTNVENTATWFPANLEEHWTSPPPHGVGSTRHATVTMLGRRTENDAVATVFDPPHRAAMQGTSPNAPFLTTLTFQDEPGGTRVQVETGFTFRGGQRVIAPLFVGWFRRAWDRGLENLKRMMEAGEL